jgi:hypothetical protein
LFSAFVQAKVTLLRIIRIFALPQLDIIDKLNYLESELERKLAENEFIKVHLAVYNNPSVKKFKVKLIRYFLLIMLKNKLVLEK